MRHHDQHDPDSLEKLRAKAERETEELFEQQQRASEELRARLKAIAAIDAEIAARGGPYPEGFDYTDELGIPMERYRYLELHVQRGRTLQKIRRIEARMRAATCAEAARGPVQRPSVPPSSRRRERRTRSSTSSAEARAAPDDEPPPELERGDPLDDQRPRGCRSCGASDHDFAPDRTGVLHTDCNARLGRAVVLRLRGRRTSWSG